MKLRAWGYEVVAPTSRAAALVPSRGVASALKDKMTPWLRDSAWPRLILVGFHVAEVGERTLPFAFLVAALGDWGYLAPVAMVPGMFMRHVARRRRVAGRGRGIISGVKSALGMALVRRGVLIHACVYLGVCLCMRRLEYLQHL